MASNSSKNSTQGAAAAARANSSRTAASLWPMYLFSSSGPWSQAKEEEGIDEETIRGCVLLILCVGARRSKER
jgi:hypothetical protein